MNAKITLSFDKEVIEEAKAFAAQHNMSLSMLTEFLYGQIAGTQYKTLGELPISDWVNMVAEGKPEYRRTRSRKELKAGFYNSEK